MPRFAHLIVAALTLAAVATGSTAADREFPTRPITLVVPFSAGGAVDAVGRLIGEQLSRSLGQPVVIENVTGAGGTIASTRVARAASDGYTMLLGNLGTHVASVGNYKNLQYDPRRDFAPIIIVANTPEVLLVNKDSPSNSLQEFIAYTKSADRPVTIGTAGIGSVSHLSYLLFCNLSKTSPLVVPYRGDLEADRDLMSGRIDAVFNWTTLALPYVKSGQLKALAVLSPTRSAVMSAIPSATEAGMPELLVNAWTALFFPKDTSRPIIERVNALLQKALTDEIVVKRMNAIGLDVPPPEQRTPEALDQLVKSELDKWLPLIQRMN
jgi:tripartite-type tricarboxylate transporter receptor subunit TctC